MIDVDADTRASRLLLGFGVHFHTRGQRESAKAESLKIFWKVQDQLNIPRYAAENELLQFRLVNEQKFSKQKTNGEDFRANKKHLPLLSLESMCGSRAPPTTLGTVTSMHCVVIFGDKNAK